MNSRTELFAIVKTQGRKASESGYVSEDLDYLLRDEESAIRFCEGTGKHFASVTNEYGKLESGLKYSYVSTTDHRYDSDGNRVEERNLPEVNAGGCNWMVLYTITFENKHNTYTFNACKWSDFS